MRSTYGTLAFGLLFGLHSVVALPAPIAAPAPVPARGNNALAQILQGTGLTGMTATEVNALLKQLQTQTSACNATAEAGDGKTADGEAGAEEGEANEKNIVGTFDTAVALDGGDLKQDTLFTKSAVGSFEFEFQSKTADTLTVTENKTPAAPPAGFEAIEPSSFKVSLAQSKGVGLTLSKIDYIFDTTSASLDGKDITKAQVGRLCPDTGAFAISETLGELEFEAEEGEVTLNLNKAVTSEGEWGIFLPVAAAAAAGANTKKEA